MTVGETLWLLWNWEPFSMVAMLLGIYQFVLGICREPKAKCFAITANGLVVFGGVSILTSNLLFGPFMDDMTLVEQVGDVRIFAIPTTLLQLAAFCFCFMFWYEMVVLLKMSWDPMYEATRRLKLGALLFCGVWVCCYLGLAVYGMIINSLELEWEQVVSFFHWRAAMWTLVGAIALGWTIIWITAIRGVSKALGKQAVRSMAVYRASLGLSSWCALCVPIFSVDAWIAYSNAAAWRKLIQVREDGRPWDDAISELEHLSHFLELFVQWTQPVMNFILFFALLIAFWRDYRTRPVLDAALLGEHDCHSHIGESPIFYPPDDNGSIFSFLSSSGMSDVSFGGGARPLKRSSLSHLSQPLVSSAVYIN